MTQSYLSACQRIEGLPKWQIVRLETRSLPMYWWAFLFPDIRLLLRLAVVMLTQQAPGMPVFHSLCSSQKTPSASPPALLVINGFLLMLCPGKRFAMIPKRFIRRIIRLLTSILLISLLLISLLSWVSVSPAGIGELGADTWLTSITIIGAKIHALQSAQTQLIFFGLLLFLFAVAIGIVFYWRRQSNFFRKEMHRSERKVQEVLDLFTFQQAELDTLLDTVSDLVLFLTPDQKITWVNKRAESILGLEYPALIGRSCHEIWHTLIGDGFLCPGRKCLLSGVPERSIGWTRHKKQFDIRAVPVKDSRGDVVRIIEIGSDITTSSRLEQQLRHLQKMDSIGWLTTGIIHDFNNILTGIFGFAYLLQKRCNSDDQVRNYLTNIISAAERAEILTRTFLAFSRSQPVSIAPEDLNAIIRGVEGLLVRVLGEDVNLRLILSGSEIPVLADSLLLGQVLLNIAVHCRNAMSASGDFVIRTTVSSNSGGDCDEGFAEPCHSACLHIEVPGGRVTRRVFDDLQEVFSSAVSFGEGVDLGLAVVRGIVEQHGGSITFATETGTGGIFTLHLPLDRNACFESRKVKTPLPISGKNEVILVVEDDKWARSFLRELLEGNGYKVIEAEEALAAMEKFRHHGSSIALVLCDMIIPNMSGRELCRELACIRPNLKVLFMSGYPVEAIRARGIITNDVTILSKPFKPEELLYAVRSVLDSAG